MNVEDKIGSISQNNLNVLTAMRLGASGGSAHFENKKIKTVSALPKVQSLDARMISKLIRKSSKLDGIEEERGTVKDNEDSENSSDDFTENDNDLKSNSEEMSDSGDSSIDMDGEDDEEALYKAILNEQTQVAEQKEAKKKGKHLDDLVDKEMISLLNVCKRLHCPTEEAIESRKIKFGPKT